jgi:serine/threonine-protein kinase
MRRHGFGHFSEAALEVAGAYHLTMASFAPDSRAATESRRPVHRGRGRSPTPTSTTGPRGIRNDPRASDAEERRRSLPKMFAFMTVGWLLFGLVDLYVWLVLSPSTSLAWLVLMRVLGAVPPIVGWFVTRKGRQPDALTTMLEMATFVGAALCLSERATQYGGLDSHSVHGVSLILMIQTMSIPAPWRRNLPLALVTYSVYPLVMLIAAIFDPAIAAQWHSRDALEFAHDYTLVASCAIGGAIGGHMVWAMRRQLYYARRLGRYRLKARIAQGGMSEVWLAWDDGLKRDVALKILDRSASGDDVAIARFEREAMAASSLQSPHTIRVFDFGASDDGVWFIAMEHLEGVDLTTLVDDVGPLPCDRALRLVRQACAALAEAHDAGVIHRDVKPDNLFVCRMGDEPDFLKVLDFGIASVEGAEASATVTRAGWVHGTPAYMSPEVCNGQRADARSDIYSLGSVLYFLLTATPPFTAKSAAAVMIAHVHETPKKPSDRVPVPPSLERIVLRCLAKEPEDRYASARELDAALAACAGGLARPTSQGPMRSSPTPRAI